MQWAIVGRLRWRHAAKQYARRLPPILLQRYGGAETYTAAQIRAATAAARLNQRFLALGLAAFLDEPEFNLACADLKLRLPYAEAKALLARFKLSQPYSASAGPPPDRSYMVGPDSRLP